MQNHLIVIRLNNVHKNEQKTLKTYLEHNCWDWNEITNETFKESIVVDDNNIPQSIYGLDGRKKVNAK